MCWSEKGLAQNISIGEIVNFALSAQSSRLGLGGQPSQKNPQMCPESTNWYYNQSQNSALGCTVRGSNIFIDKQNMTTASTLDFNSTNLRQPL